MVAEWTETVSVDGQDVDIAFTMTGTPGEQRGDTLIVDCHIDYEIVSQAADETPTPNMPPTI